MTTIRLFARQLADVVLSKFYDNDDGGFYFRSDGCRTLDLCAQTDA